MNKQITLSALTGELAQTSTRKKAFLERMERIIPWDKWMGIIKPYSYKGERGNKPCALGTMLRIHLLQELYDLADIAVMNEPIDSRSFSEFFGIDSSNRVQDRDTIGRFRALLIKTDCRRSCFTCLSPVIVRRGLRNLQAKHHYRLHRPKGDSPFSLVHFL